MITQLQLIIIIIIIIIITVIIIIIIIIIKNCFFMWDIPVCGEYKLVQLIVNHTQ